MDEVKKKRVLCPCSGKDGKTYWVGMGRAFTNRDNSINVYLDSLPVNGKLQIRDWEDPPWEKRERGAPGDGAASRPAAQQQSLPGDGRPAGNDDLPF